MSVAAVFCISCLGWFVQQQPGAGMDHDLQSETPIDGEVYWAQRPLFIAILVSKQRLTSQLLIII